jgi:GDP-4-dehydro-6-deoxy-D-mannose reductase
MGNHQVTNLATPAKLEYNTRDVVRVARRNTHHTLRNAPGGPRSTSGTKLHSLNQTASKGTQGRQRLKALITGISGFVGTHLTQYLLDNTDWQVAGTVFGPYGSIKPWWDRLELYPAELSRLEVVVFILEQVQPDCVFHLAAQPLVSLSHRDPWGTLENNIHMQLNILHGLVELKMLATRLLVVSSSEVYGPVKPEDLPIRETQPFRPTNPYAVSKIAQEMLALQYHLTHGVQAIRVRPFNHIGPGQRPGFVVPDFAQQIAAIEAGQSPPVMRVGNLTARRDFTDVRDVVRAYQSLITQGKPSQVYNLGSGRSHAIQEVLDTLLSISQVEIAIEPDPARMRPSDTPDMVCDATQLRRQTGWQPTIPFEQSLIDVLDYWRERV